MQCNCKLLTVIIRTAAFINDQFAFEELQELRRFFSLAYANLHAGTLELLVHFNHLRLDAFNFSGAGIHTLRTKNPDAVNKARFTIVWI